MIVVSVIDAIPRQLAGSLRAIAGAGMVDGMSGAVMTFGPGDGSYQLLDGRTRRNLMPGGSNIRHLPWFFKLAHHE